MSDSRPNLAPWWEPRRLPEGQIRFWRIGSLQLWLLHAPREWRVSLLQGEEALHEPSVAGTPDGPPTPAEGVQVYRYGFHSRSDEMELRPLLADRAVVVGASPPFFLPPGESTTLYVSTSIWVQLRVGSESVALLEQPITRPSDTWFGPSTRVGELCYASRTGARLDVSNVPHVAHRAITAVKIDNHADTQLPLERLRLPMPQLSVFAAADGSLWTEAIHYDREADGEDATLRISEAPPAEAGQVKRVSGPREVARKGLLTRAFGGLFSSRGME